MTNQENPRKRLLAAIEMLTAMIDASELDTLKQAMADFRNIYLEFEATTFCGLNKSQKFHLSAQYGSSLGDVFYDGIGEYDSSDIYYYNDDTGELLKHFDDMIDDMDFDYNDFCEELADKHNCSVQCLDAWGAVMATAYPLRPAKIIVENWQSGINLPIGTIGVVRETVNDYRFRKEGSDKFIVIPSYHFKFTDVEESTEDA